ncbi:MAG: M20/M25/M40 family metallo-hydrolase, partial [Bacteroidota bacterium]
QHNVVPDTCTFVADIRLNELYTHQEVVQLFSSVLQSSVTLRGTRIRSTAIATDHPLVQAGTAMGKQAYGSPTTSDKALMNFPALKMGPGDSARSHTANEYILLSEIEAGIETYIELLIRFFELSKKGNS